MLNSRAKLQAHYWRDIYGPAADNIHPHASQISDAEENLDVRPTEHEAKNAVAVRLQDDPPETDS